MLAGDRETLDLLHDTAGLGELGRLLRQSGAVQPAQQLRVLTADNATQYWEASDRHLFLLDLTHELTQELSHGLTLKMTRARSVEVTLSRKVLYELDGGDREKVKSLEIDVEPGAIEVCVPVAA